ncbi:uroporphyrinogen-III synthase [Brachybacterium aquaticum]|uniref:Uroporphyrinogen-III synthase n=1 Tax=Brachybacterium aquaticum TaxID=1432564 RepID=A0A841A678_9MICO|nr:uroporphyrinogen-III synthase [Brachybacterium aquaticum]MBB5830356.1 uroporphyrinogen-III synthase [Brachybacterium aquaticum]
MDASSATAAHVLVPAPAGQAGSLIAALRAQGLRADHTPFVELRDQRDTDTRAAAAALTAGGIGHLAVTSPRSVQVLAEVAAALAADGAAVDGGGSAAADGADAALPLPADATVTALGEETGEALTAAGVPGAALTVVAAEADLAAAVLEATSEGDAVLLAGPAHLAPDLAQRLRSAGRDLTVAVTHRVRSTGLDTQTVRDLRLHGVDALVLTTPLLADLAGHLGIHRDIRVVAADASTAARAEARELVVHGIAAEPTAASLAAAVRTALDTPVVHD